MEFRVHAPDLSKDLPSVAALGVLAHLATLAANASISAYYTEKTEMEMEKRLAAQRRRNLSPMAEDLRQRLYKKEVKKHFLRIKKERATARERLLSTLQERREEEVSHG